MRQIRKYPNRKMYDTSEKKYVTLDQVAELIRAGEEVRIVDSKTGDDLTSATVSQILAREKNTNQEEVPPGLLIGLLQKGRGAVSEYTKKYFSLWQSAVTMAEDEIDKVVGRLVKDKEISESEGKTLKEDILDQAAGLRKWIGDKIDEQINEVFGKMNLVSRDQITELTKKIEALTALVEALEKSRAGSVETSLQTVHPDSNQDSEESDDQTDHLPERRAALI
ncbi:MAG: hypothetical protein HQK58_06215 [Deltaproteobacteria bacterium]|nr:hypothetical protein [Deltaproteobacteria bacterium]